MARTSLKMSGGMAKAHVVDQPYYLKAVPMNPYVGSVHDGLTGEYGQGFMVKKIPFLYRFRHNLLPTGIQTGFFSRNPMGKHVHWLEVSTIEKLRVRATGEEAFPPMVLSAVVISFTIYHLWRYLWWHPDLTNYNIVLWTTKPWVMQTRFSQVHPMDKPIFRYLQRVPEYYNIDDPIRMIYGNEIAANDPYFDFMVAKGKKADLFAKPTTRGWGEGGFGKLLPRNDLPKPESKSGHDLSFMRMQ